MHLGSGEEGDASETFAGVATTLQREVIEQTDEQTTHGGYLRGHVLCTPTHPHTFEPSRPHTVYVPVLSLCTCQKALGHSP